MSSRSTSHSPKRKIKKEKRNHRSRSPVHSTERRHDKDERRRKHEHHGSRSDEGVKVALHRVKVEPREDQECSHNRLTSQQHSSSNRLSPGRRQPEQLRSSPGRRPQDEFRQQREERRRNDHRRIDNRARRQRTAEEEHPWGGERLNASEQEAVKKEKEKPSLALSGKLTEDTNTFRGVVIKYNEPPEARRPKKHWRFYPFKGEEALPVLHLHRQSAFLLGRDRRVADIPIDHPSCSKQHAALQFRLVDYTRPDGHTGRRVRPYVIDLGSANGTYVNSKRIESQRYVELLEKDVVKFGFSSREYVLLHDDSDTTALQDDEGVD